MANLFDNVKNRLVDEKITPNSQQSREWFLDKAETIAHGASRDSIKSKAPMKQVATVLPGMMYMFFYSPKHANTLPYYDTFPLVILLDITNDGMTGLNLHYLPINLRQKLFYGLLNRVSGQGMNDKTYLKVTYDYLQGARSLKEYRPCFKKYLTKHIRGGIANVPATEWEIAVHLPLALFKKENESTVHRQSEQMIERF